MNKKMKTHKKQLKSKFKIDEIVLVLVVAFFAFIVSVYEKSSETGKTINAQEITEIILDDHYISFANNGVVDEDKLKEIQQIDYATLKSRLNAKNDFCVYIEDANGDVIVAKGSSKLNSEIAYCKE